MEKQVPERSKLRGHTLENAGKCQKQRTVSEKTSFEKVETTSGSRQPTEVTAKYKIVPVEDGESLFQIDTGGSADRQNPGKQSQTLQLSRESAKELWTLLGNHFRF